ncbi:MAG: hypothetical protein KF878_11835 [Planctomycetes bacterium]|nr:hypothetical protein [Planctomycetota bacterium]
MAWRRPRSSSTPRRRPRPRRPLRGALDAPRPAAPVAACAWPRCWSRAALGRAEALLQRALGALRPEDAQVEAVARATRARVLQRLGAPLADVETHARRAEALAPGAPDTRKALASLARARGDLDEAFAHLDAVARAAPRDVEAHEGLAWLHARLGSAERGVAHASPRGRRPPRPGQPHVALSPGRRGGRPATRPWPRLAGPRAEGRPRPGARPSTRPRPGAERGAQGGCPRRLSGERRGPRGWRSTWPKALAAAGDQAPRRLFRRALARATAPGPRERLAAAVAALGA